VVEPFIDGHVSGTTPNPCVACNGELRIDAMVALARRLGASSLATGHYARLHDDGAGPLLAAPADSAKDQTYMLAAVSPRTLAALAFPLAGLRKPEVREHAARAGLPVATKAESQDLCFLAGEGKRAFLARHGGLADRDGEIVDRTGRLRGRHSGHQHFTVGQRRGLGIADHEPLYVLSTDSQANTVTVGGREELATRTVRLRRATLHRPPGRIDRVRLRYHSAAIGCRIDAGAAGGNDSLEIELDEPAYGVAPGQSACLMDGDLVVGQATIAR
jgi:tRNA-specific 2-thiouridylase